MDIQIASEHLRRGPVFVPGSHQKLFESHIKGWKGMDLPSLELIAGLEDHLPVNSKCFWIAFYYVFANVLQDLTKVPNSPPGHQTQSVARINDFWDENLKWYNCDSEAIMRGDHRPAFQIYDFDSIDVSMRDHISQVRK